MHTIPEARIGPASSSPMAPQRRARSYRARPAPLLLRPSADTTIRCASAWPQGLRSTASGADRSRARCSPDWRPPEECSSSARPARYVPGGENPLGARPSSGRTLFRIHGSNEPESIGHAVSSGCIRMLNEDVMDLYDRVKVGTKVVVMRWNKSSPRRHLGRPSGRPFLLGLLRRSSSRTHLRDPMQTRSARAEQRPACRADGLCGGAHWSSRLVVLVQQFRNSRPMLGTSSCEFRNHKPHYKRLILVCFSNLKFARQDETP